MKQYIIAIVFFSLVTHMNGPLRGQHIVWVDGSFAGPQLRTARADGSEYHAINLDPASLPEGLALDNAGSIYWTELRFQSARVLHARSGFYSPSVLTTGGSALRGICVDPRNGAVYWASSNLSLSARIFRYSPATTAVETLAVLGFTSNPRSLVLDTLRNCLYWCEFDEGTIRKLQLGVPGPPTSMVVNLGGPVGLALDTDSSALYWSEMNGNRIQKRQMNNGTVTTVLAGLSRPGYLALDRGAQKIVWTEREPARIRIAGMDGSNPTTLPLAVTIPGGIAIASSWTSANRTEVDGPVELSLFQNYPNPFNPSTTIQYALPRKGHVTLEVFSVLGERVAVLQDGPQEAGIYTATFGGKSGGNASGVYFYRLSVGGAVRMRSMVYLK
jgi:hypothetical protein